MTKDIKEPNWASFEEIGSAFEQEVDTNYIGNDPMAAYRHRDRVSTGEKPPKWQPGPPQRNDGE